MRDRPENAVVPVPDLFDAEVDLAYTHLEPT